MPQSLIYSSKIINQPEKDVKEEEEEKEEKKEEEEDL